MGKSKESSQVSQRSSGVASKPEKVVSETLSSRVDVKKKVDLTSSDYVEQLIRAIDGVRARNTRGI